MVAKVVDFEESNQESYDQWKNILMKITNFYILNIIEFIYILSLEAIKLAYGYNNFEYMKIFYDDI
jgi:hypothetical protein